MNASPAVGHVVLVHGGFEHRHLDRHGDGWTGVREGVSTGGGWPHYLDRYAELLTR